MRLLLPLLAAFSATPLWSEAITLQSTTSTANSGLYDHLLPLFHRQAGIDVNVVAVGTGQAIKNAMNCDADVLLVHAKSAEEKFVAQGGGVKRTDLMYNDFVVVGPADDPAGIQGDKSVVSALGTLAQSNVKFASRGDDSGTHKKELSLWQSAGIDPEPFSGDWYLETGAGMGATLNTAIGLGAYVMTDRATWISFGNKQDFEVMVESDPLLFNQYGVILVDPTRCKNVDASAGQSLIDWLLSDVGQQAIADYQIDGQRLFFPNAPAK